MTYTGTRRGRTPAPLEPARNRTARNDRRWPDRTDRAANTPARKLATRPGRRSATVPAATPR